MRVLTLRLVLTGRHEAQHEPHTDGRHPVLVRRGRLLSVGGDARTSR
jgi:hypothetical protein